MGSRQYLYVGNYIKIKDENFNIYEFEENIGKEENYFESYTDCNVGSVIILNSDVPDQGMEWDLGENPLLTHKFENSKPFSDDWNLLKNELSKNNIEFEEVYGIFVYLM